MIFNELYGAYYRTVAAVLRAAADHPVTRSEVYRIMERYGLGESMLTIPAALGEERWQLLHRDGTTPLLHAPDTPLTLTEKQWLKAVYADPRVRLFGDDFPDFPDAEPLFRPEDVVVFDRYADGDPYTDREYVSRFRMILRAVRERIPVRIEMVTPKGNVSRVDVMPDHLEYSEKDDKFRLIGLTRRSGRSTVNLGRVRFCALLDPKGDFFDGKEAQMPAPKQETVELLVVDERNTLERVLMHFAHFRKEAERIGENRYRVSVTYDMEDEREMVIRILSFGPTVRVTAPDSFVSLIRYKLMNQKSCGR